MTAVTPFNARRTSFEKFGQLPDQLELIEGFLKPKHWSFYGVINERRLASVRDRIAARLQAFVQTGELGGVAIEGNTILVRGKADSVLLAVLTKSSREQVEEYLAHGADVWDVAVFVETLRSNRTRGSRLWHERALSRTPAVLPGFKLTLPETFRERPK